MTLGGESRFNGFTRRTLCLRLPSSHLHFSRGIFCRRCALHRLANERYTCALNETCRKWCAVDDLHLENVHTHNAYKRGVLEKKIRVLWNEGTSLHPYYINITHSYHQKSFVGKVSCAWLHTLFHWNRILGEEYRLNPSSYKQYSAYTHVRRAKR